MKIKIAAILILMLGACKSTKGEKGDTGITGARGPGQMEVLTGPVTSNDFTVTDSRIGNSLSGSVYIGDSTNLIESPYFLPGLGINTYYIATPGQSKIQILNASSAGATRYVIVLILP